MEKYRCFVAVDLPQEVKDVLAYVQTNLSSWPGRVKWVEREKIHLTLKFLGDVEIDKIPEIASKLAENAAAQPAFTLLIKGLGAFPALRNPKVIWAGVEDPDNRLGLLQRRIEEGLAAIGFPPEMKKFSPHLTLGRVKDSPQNTPFDISKASLPIGNDRDKKLAAPVRMVHLMRSILSPEGPQYIKLHSFPLQETLEAFPNRI